MRLHFPFIVLFLLSGCVGDAPRDNPLDPLSPGFSSRGTVTGQVVTAKRSTGIAGATITDLTEATTVSTDSSGYFLFPHRSAGTHTFIVSKSNFTSDTFSVTVQSGATANVLRSLNGPPSVTFQRILTRKVDQFFPSTMYSVEVEAAVTDPNNDNELVSVSFAVDTFRYPLSYNVLTKKFTRTLDKGSFPTNTIQWLVGKPLSIVARDTLGAENAGAPFYVTRVIENAAVPQSPTNNESLKQDSIYFSWSEPDVTFNFTYSVNVSIVVSGTTTSVWTKTGLNATDQPLKFPNDGSIVLSPGNYVWSVFIVDEFGNSSRSKEYPFTVIP